MTRKPPMDRRILNFWRDGRWILQTLLSHWRKNPTQAVTLFVGLAVSTALFAGVQAINFQARSSYADAAAQLGANQLATLTPPGDAFDENAFAALRRAGWPVSPIIEGRIIVDGARYTILGVDLATMPQAAMGSVFNGFNNTDPDRNRPDYQPSDFLLPPYLGLGSLETVERLTSASDKNVSLPPLAALDGMMARTLFMDIGAAQQTLGMQGKLSRLIIDHGDTSALPSPTEITGVDFTRRAPVETADISRLTNSFHLNLTAFGFLSFFVGLLIVYSAIGLAFEQRRPMIRTLRACGVSRSGLTIALIIELIIIALIAGAAGIVLGYAIAAGLLPNVALTLRSLYGASVPGALTVDPAWWALGLGIAVAGVLLAAANSLQKAARLPVLTPALPEAWRAAEQRGLARNSLIAFALLGLSALLVTFGGSLISGFVLMGTALLAAALLLPVVLSFILQIGESMAKKPVTHWFWADGRQQLPAISLALQALMIALAVNIGVGAMVASFRDTFTGWLDQRLAAELYVNATQADASAVEDYLRAHDDVETVLPAAFTETRYSDLPVRVMGVTVHETYSEHWPLIARTPNAWQAVQNGGAVLINEQMARRFDLKPGSQIDVPTSIGSMRVDVAAIYSDYGNTYMEIMTAFEVVRTHWPDTTTGLFLVRTNPEKVSEISQKLITEFSLTENNLIDQQGLKAISQQIFERTFSVTAALNVLTLAVAGVALLTSLLSLSSARLPQVAPLWAAGLTRAQLSLLDFFKTLAFAFLTGLFAIPLGILIAWLLTNVINVEAFGWRLPLFFYPSQWGALVMLAVATAAIASAPAIIALRRTEPARLLKVFSDGR